MTLADHRRSPEADPPRRDGPRRRRRGPRERGRPHDGRELGDARRRSTSCCAGRAGSCACRATRRRPRRARHLADGAAGQRRLRHRVHGVDRPRRPRAAASAPPTGATRSAGASTPTRRPDRLHPPRPRVPAARPRRAACSSAAGHTEAAVDLARLAGPAAGRGDLRGAPRRRLAGAASRSSSCSPQEHRIAIIAVDQVAAHRSGLGHRASDAAEVSGRAPLLL